MKVIYVYGLISDQFNYNDTRESHIFAFSNDRCYFFSVSNNWYLVLHLSLTWLCWKHTRTFDILIFSSNMANIINLCSFGNIVLNNESFMCYTICINSSFNITTDSPYSGGNKMVGMQTLWIFIWFSSYFIMDNTILDVWTSFMCFIKIKSILQSMELV